METPQFKEGNLETFNSSINRPLYELRNTNIRALIGLYISQFLLCVGFVLVLLNNLNILAPGNYFGVYSWVTATVFSIGLFINFISIPHLYISSFINFSRDDDFWDKETFWILPLFFFGSFFLYGSQIQAAAILLAISLAVIAITHFKFIWSSWRFLKKDMGKDAYSPHHQYFMTLKYLTAYYVLLLLILVFYNPLQHIFIWIRTNL